MNDIKKLNTLTPDGQLYYNPLLDTTEALIPNDPYNSCHAADLLELPNGDILCAYFAGSQEGYSDISIVISRLKAGTYKWTMPVKVSDDPERSEQNPSLFLNPDTGEIWLMYTAQCSRKPDTDPELSLQCTAEIRGKKSTDNGETWGKTITMFSEPGSFCRQKIQVLSSGRWIFGNWMCFADHSHNGSDITVFRISDDRGNTWKTVPLPNSRGRVHANIIEVAPRRLICLLRSRFADNIYRCESHDDGDTWTEPVRTELPNNNSSITAIRLQTGGIAIIYNHCRYNEDTSKTVWPRQRCPIAIAISDDEGMTWPIRRIIEPGEMFFGPFNDINNRRYEYPVMMQGIDGRIHTAWTWGTRKNIKYAVIDEKWIRGEKICDSAIYNPTIIQPNEK